MSTNGHESETDDMAAVTAPSVVPAVATEISVPPVTTGDAISLATPADTSAPPDTAAAAATPTPSRQGPGTPPQQQQQAIDANGEGDEAGDVLTDLPHVSSDLGPRMAIARNDSLSSQYFGIATDAAAGGPGSPGTAYLGLSPGQDRRQSMDPEATERPRMTGLMTDTHPGSYNVPTFAARDRDLATLVAFEFFAVCAWQKCGGTCCFTNLLLGLRCAVG